MSSNPKKVVLFLVEGVSDELALGPMLSKIIQSDQVKFKVIHGDITSDYYRMTPATITNKIKDVVRSFLGSIYRIDDIAEIVHIVDSDGVYISDSQILSDTCEKTTYRDATIHTQYSHEIKKRNTFKRTVLNMLSQRTSIRLGRGSSEDIPYRLLYMSCNLDHVIVGDRNLDITQKKAKAIEFSDSFYDNPNGFYEFFMNTDILKGQTYTESWDHLRKDNNSLSRCSNLGIYLDSIDKNTRINKCTFAKLE